MEGLVLVVMVFLFTVEGAILVGSVERAFKSQNAYLKRCLVALACIASIAMLATFVVSCSMFSV